ncbi:hypothetical protein RUND412_007724 [Rhizina undulata]
MARKRSAPCCNHAEIQMARSTNFFPNCIGASYLRGSRTFSRYGVSRYSRRCPTQKNEDRFVRHEVKLRWLKFVKETLKSRKEMNPMFWTDHRAMKNIESIMTMPRTILTLDEWKLARWRSFQWKKGISLRKVMARQAKEKWKGRFLRDVRA